jgi:uncharacterized protein YkwD
MLQSLSKTFSRHGNPRAAFLSAAALIPAAAALQFAFAGEAIAAQEFVVPFPANQYILDQTNAYRVQKGLPKLSAHQPPNAAADAYAHYLATHTGWDKNPHGADGRDPAARVKAQRGKFCGVWENVHTSATWPNKEDAIAAMKKAMTFWKTSPGHEANLRSPSDQIGIGVAGWKDGDKWHYVEVQVFIKTKCN